MISVYQNRRRRPAAIVALHKLGRHTNRGMCNYYY